MPVEIQGENTGSFMMFDEVATQLLRMMGQSGKTQGAIRATDVPGALASIKSALDKLPAEPTNNDDTNNDAQPVSLHTRAKPLIDLLEESIKKGGYVVWKPK